MGGVEVRGAAETVRPESKIAEKRHYYQRAGRFAPSLIRRYYRLLEPAREILDLGCGVGDLGREAASHRAKVFGLDHDLVALRQARVHETVVLADLSRAVLPFRAESFDGIIAKDVVEHVAEPWSLLGEIRRVLRVGGKVLVSVPMEYPWVVWNDYTHVRGFTQEAARLLLKDQGFRILHCAPMGGVPLAGRMGAVDAIPVLLRFPGMRRLFGRSWEVLAARE